MNEQDKAIRETVNRERGRLFRFIRDRVPETEDAEDILQDVFSELVQAYRTMQSIERVTSWLFTVARNRITDLYRKKKPVAESRLASVGGDDDDTPLTLSQILPDFSSMPDDELMRQAVWDQLEAALDELPATQREVFVLHEFEDMSFKEIAEKTGVGQNTLLSRKRYAVLHLRERLQELYDELVTGKL